MTCLKSYNQQAIEPELKQTQQILLLSFGLYYSITMYLVTYDLLNDSLI